MLTLYSDSPKEDSLRLFRLLKGLFPYDKSQLIEGTFESREPDGSYIVDHSVCLRHPGLPSIVRPPLLEVSYTSSNPSEITVALSDAHL